MKIAAFDLGSTYACAHNWFKGPPGRAAWHLDINPYRAKPKLAKKRPEVLAVFASHLDFLRLEQPDVVVQSRPFARGEAATRMLWGMAGILEAAAHNAGCAILDFSDTEIKKWATGSGKATKEEMIAAAQRLGYAGDNEHEADAFCLLCMAEATLTKG
jgi:Holliday junction resolvasome RuvABC endonuclease subunit